MSVKKPVIDLGYRPQSYFWPITHDTHVIAAIKGERRRSEIRNAYDADRVTPLDALYASPTLPDEDRLALGRLHPSFMGGECLPDRRDTEVEIARINIDSTTSDVTSVYAKAGKDRIRCRVVDEYWGDTLSENRTRSSKRPLSLGELIVSLGAWPRCGRRSRGTSSIGTGRRKKRIENGWSERKTALVQLQTVRSSGTTSC